MTDTNETYRDQLQAQMLVTGEENAELEKALELMLQDWLEEDKGDEESWVVQAQTSRFDSDIFNLEDF